MPDPLMGSSSIEIGDILFEFPMQLTFIQNEDVIQTLAANTAQKPFTNGIGFGSADRRPQDFDAAGSARKFRAVFAVVVADQKSRMGAERGSFAELLSHPSITRGARDREMNDPARTQLDDEKDKDRAKPDVVSLKEITSPDVRRVIGEKGGPGLSALPRGLGTSHLPDVFGNGSLAETITQFAQLILNALGAP